MTFPLHELLSDSVTLVVLQATAIMCCAILIGSAFPKRAALRSCIHMSAVFCMFVGPVVLLACSFSGYTKELPFRVSFLEDPPEILSGATQPGHQLRASGLGTYEYTDVLKAIVTAETPDTIHEPRLSVKSWLLVFWSCGSLFFGLGIAMSMVRICRLLRTVKQIDGETYCVATKHAAANLGVAEFPRIGISNRIHSPVAVGLLGNAWVLLPKKCLDAMSQDQLIQVLTHEGAHVIRRDPMIRLLQRINLALWWWNPLAHFLHGQLSRAREEVCDNVVLAGTDGDVYGTTLLELGKLISSDKYLVGSVGLFGSRWSLEHRIKGILNPGRKTMVKVNRTVFALVFATFVGVTMLTSVTRVDAQEALVRERNAERRLKMEYFEHITAAHQHLKQGGNEELANMVGKHAREMANSLDIDYDQILGRYYKQIRRERSNEGNDEKYWLERVLNDRDDEPRRDDERRNAREQNSFQNDARETLDELAQAFKSLRGDVEELKAEVRKSGEGEE